MRVRILGTRGEVEQSAPYHSRHSGILIDGTLLVDVGERGFLEYGPQAVLITHLHPDHAYFVRAGTDRPPAGIPIYAPEGYRDYGVKVLEKARKIAGFNVLPIPTLHSVKVLSQAYLISDGSARILYTGDMVWINKEYHHLFEGLDLVITEGSFPRKGGLVRRDKTTGRVFGHTGTPNLVRLFKNCCRRIVLVHFGSWFYADAGRARKQIRELARANGIDIEAGYDNMEIELRPSADRPRRGRRRDRRAA